MLGLYSPEEILKIPSQPHTQEHICAHTHTPAPTHTTHRPAHTSTTHLRKPAYIHAYLHMPKHACAYPPHPHTHPHTPHILTHALNLINHMKLHVYRPNTKKTRKGEEEDRKKKEQESAEAISGLKIPL